MHTRTYIYIHLNYNTHIYKTFTHRDIHEHLRAGIKKFLDYRNRWQHTVACSAWASSDLHATMCRMTSLCLLRKLWNLCFCDQMYALACDFVSQVHAYRFFFRHPRYCALRIRPPITRPSIESSTATFWGAWGRTFGESIRICGARRIKFCTMTMPPTPSPSSLHSRVSSQIQDCIASELALFSKFSTCGLTFLQAENAA